MFIEFQYSTQAFARIVRNLIKQLDLCQLCGNEDSGDVLDRIVVRSAANSTVVQRETRLESHGGLREEVPAATLNAWVFSSKNNYNFTAPHLQVVQEFDIFTVSAAKLEANGAAPTPSDPVTVRVAFNIELRASNPTQGGGPVTLIYSFAWAHFGFLDPFIPKSDRDALEAKMAQANLATRTLDLGPLNDLAGGAMRAFNAGIGLCSGGTGVALRIDVEVYETMPAVSSEFFTSGPPNVLGGQDWAILIDKALLIRSTTDQVRNGLSTSSKIKRIMWGPNVTWDSAAPRLIIGAGVELHGGGQALTEEIDLDVDVQATLSFSIKSSTELSVTFHLHAEPSNTVEIAATVATAALFWPFIGSTFLDEVNSDSPVADFIAGMVLGPVSIWGQFISGVNTVAYQSFDPATLGPHCAKIGDSNVECTYPLAINLGSAVLPVYLRAAATAATAQGLILRGPIEMKDVPDEVITVSSYPFEWTLSGDCNSGYWLVDQALVQVTSSGWRGGLCSARVLNDPFSEFALAIDTGEDTVTVTARGLPVYAQLQQKYPCKVRVVTSGGVRTIVFPAPTAITPEQKKYLDGMRDSLVDVCRALQQSIHEIEWVTPRPPIPVDGPDWLHQWEVAVNGLDSGEWLDVETDVGTKVLSARASAKGVTHFAAVFGGRGGPKSLRLRRRHAAEPFRNVSTLHTLQTVFAHQLSIPTRGRVTAMHFEGPDTDRRLTIVDEAMTRIFAIGPRTPGPLLEAASLPAKGAFSRAVHHGPRLGSVLSDQGKVALRDIETRLGSAVGVGEPRVAGIIKPLFVKTETQAALYDVSQKEPELMQVYSSQPWFENRALGGSWLAHWNEGTSSVELYRVVACRKDARLEDVAATS
jgi:hypothetical protein